MENYRKVIRKNNQFKVSATTWNEKLELTDRSYSVSDIQDIYCIILMTWIKD